MDKKITYIAITAILFGALFFMACGKQSEGSGATPTYTNNNNVGTGGNPHVSTAGSQTSTT